MHICKNKLALAMAAKQMSFGDLAQKAGVSRTSLSYINSGKACRAVTVGKVAHALGVPAEKLVRQEAVG